MTSKTSLAISPSGRGRTIVAGVAVTLLACTAPTAADSGLPFETLLAVCASCHGEDGRGELVPSWGRIAGQNRGYLVYALKLYRANGRTGVNAGLMAPYATVLSEQEIDRLARHYSRLP